MNAIKKEQPILKPIVDKEKIEQQKFDFMFRLFILMLDEDEYKLLPINE